MNCEKQLESCCEGDSPSSSDEELCPICYEPFDEDSSDDTSFEETDIEAGHRKMKDAISTGCSQQHRYCQECLMDYCEHCVTSRQIPVPCPGHASTMCLPTSDPVSDPLHHSDSSKSLSPSGCDEPLSETLVIQLLSQAQDAHDDGLVRTFHRGLALAKNPALIPCPRCDELVDEATKSDSEATETNHPVSSHQRTCQACMHVFCPEHGDAHAGMTCDEWYAQTAAGQQVLATEQALRSSQYIRPCSHCGMALHKTAGCDHVVCVACQKDMCFACGTHEYLTGKVIRHCTKCQQGFVDHRYARHYQIRTCLTLPFVLPAYLLYMAIMGAVAIVSLGFCACFWCGTEMMILEDDETVKGANDKRKRSSKDERVEEVRSSSSPTAEIPSLEYPSSVDENKEPDWLHGVRIGMAIVFLPLLMVVHDLFGTRFSALDELLTNNNQNNHNNQHETADILNVAEAERRQPAAAMSVDETVRTSPSFDSSV